MTTYNLTATVNVEDLPTLEVTTVAAVGQCAGVAPEDATPVCATIEYLAVLKDEENVAMDQKLVMIQIDAMIQPLGDTETSMQRLFVTDIRKDGTNNFFSVPLSEVSASAQYFRIVAVLPDLTRSKPNVVQIVRPPPSVTVRGAFFELNDIEAADDMLHLLVSVDGGASLQTNDFATVVMFYSTDAANSGTFEVNENVPFVAVPIQQTTVTHTLQLPLSQALSEAYLIQAAVHVTRQYPIAAPYLMSEVSAISPVSNTVVAEPLAPTASTNVTLGNYDLSTHTFEVQFNQPLVGSVLAMQSQVVRTTLYTMMGTPIGDPVDTEVDKDATSATISLASAPPGAYAQCAVATTYNIGDAGTYTTEFVQATNDNLNRVYRMEQANSGSIRSTVLTRTEDPTTSTLEVTVVAPVLAAFMSEEDMPMYRLTIEQSRRVASDYASDLVFGRQELTFNRPLFTNETIGGVTRRVGKLTRDITHAEDVVVKLYLTLEMFQQDLNNPSTPLTNASVSATVQGGTSVTDSGDFSGLVLDTTGPSVHGSFVTPYDINPGAALVRVGNSNSRVVFAQSVMTNDGDVTQYTHSIEHYPLNLETVDLAAVRAVAASISASLAQTHPTVAIYLTDVDGSVASVPLQVRGTQAAPV